MGLINKIFGNSEKERTSKKVLPWRVLTSLNQLDEINKLSQEKLVVLFKHSTRCGTSSMALRQFESHYNFPDDSVYLYFLDLLSYREISNEIAIRFQVLHQSPQLILIKNGETVHHASHYHINAEDIAKFID